MLKTLHKSVDIFVTDCRCLKADSVAVAKKKDKVTNGKNVRIYYTTHFSLILQIVNERAHAHARGVIV